MVEVEVAMEVAAPPATTTTTNPAITAEVAEEEGAAGKEDLVASSTREAAAEDCLVDWVSNHNHFFITHLQTDKSGHLRDAEALQGCSSTSLLGFEDKNKGSSHPMTSWLLRWLIFDQAGPH